MNDRKERIDFLNKVQKGLISTEDLQQQEFIVKIADLPGTGMQAELLINGTPTPKEEFWPTLFASLHKAKVSFDMIPVTVIEIDHTQNPPA